MRNEAARALALNPSDTDALAILGSVALGYDYDAQEVERVWRALGERPDSNAAVYFGIQYVPSRTGTVTWSTCSTGRFKMIP